MELLYLTRLRTHRRRAREPRPSLRRRRARRRRSPRRQRQRARRPVCHTGVCLCLFVRERARVYLCACAPVARLSAWLVPKRSCADALARVVEPAFSPRLVCLFFDFPHAPARILTSTLSPRFHPDFDMRNPVFDPTASTYTQSHLSFVSALHLPCECPNDRGWQGGRGEAGYCPGRRQVQAQSQRQGVHHILPQPHTHILTSALCPHYIPKYASQFSILPRAHTRVLTSTFVGPRDLLPLTTEGAKEGEEKPAAAPAAVKSKLNPNAKEFTMNVNAKPFVPVCVVCVVCGVWVWLCTAGGRGRRGGGGGGCNY